MLPSIDLRIDTLLKAIEQIVLPALPEHEKLAQEQARLVAGHLRMIKGQWKYAQRFENGSLDAMRTLAENLLPHVTPAQSTALQAALTATAGADREDYESVNAAIITLGTAVDAIILGDNGAIPLSDGASAVILDYGARQSFRERAWFAANTQDPDKAQLPPITAVI